MADRFNRIDNTAPVTDVAEGLAPDVKYSMFDYTQKEIGQALPYALIPIDVIPTLPNSHYWLNYDLMISFRNPTIRKLMNGFRVYLHAYYNRCSDLWEGWNNFITKGREGLGSQNVPLEIPKLKLHFTDGDGTYSKCTPMSLCDYMGIPPEVVPGNSTGNTLNKYTGILGAAINQYTQTGMASYDNAKINALPFMMYQRLWRDKYAPQNLIQDNKSLFPNNEDHFILSYEADDVSIIKYEDEDDWTPSYLDFENKAKIEKQIVGDANEPIRLDQIRFRQFQGDRFTTASPFEDMLRGTAPTLELEVDPNNLTLDMDDLNISADIMYQYNPNDPDSRAKAVAQPVGIAPASSGNTNVYAVYDNSKYDLILTSLSGQPVVNGGKVKAEQTVKPSGTIEGTAITSKIKLSTLRSLEVFTIFAERMARCSGAYNELVYSQYGHNPKAPTREADYIGGSYQDIVMNSIFQTSSSDESSALGTQAGQGISSAYNKLGEFHSQDWGYIMVIMSIVPETVYTTGLDKKITGVTFEDQYYPIMNNLSAEPILNKEIFVSGTESTDEDVWGYAERFEEWKSRRNVVKGFSQLPNTFSEYDSALVMARRFDQSQDLNSNFVTGIPSNVSLDAFASEEEPPFDYAVIKDVRAKLPMPYVTIPQGLGTRA